MKKIVPWKIILTRLGQKIVGMMVKTYCVKVEGKVIGYFGRSGHVYYPPSERLDAHDTYSNDKYFEKKSIYPEDLSQRYYWRFG